MTVGAASVIIAIGWALFFYHLTTVKSEAVDRARDDATQRTAILHAHAVQAFTEADIALQALDIRPDLPGIQIGSDLRGTFSLLRTLRDSSSLFVGIGLIDRSGKLAASADSYPPPAVDLSDRDYFRMHRNEPKVGMLISAPIITRPNNVLAIPVSRRLQDEAGGFAGVAAARLNPSYFEGLFKASGADGVLLFRADGIPLVAYSTKTAEPIENIANAASLGNRIYESNSDIVQTVTPAKDTQWVFAYSVSQEFPVGIAVAIDLDNRLAAWRKSRNLLAAGAAGGTLLVALFAILLVHRIRFSARIAEELQTAREVADLARIDAESASRAKSEFLAHMSHELRTPLNAISGFSQVMSSEMFGPIGNPRYAEYARIVYTSAGYLLDIINNILDLAKVDAGKWEVELQPVELHAVAEDLRNLTQGRAQALAIDYSIVIPMDLPVVVTDRRLLLQILVNLATNAIKFTPNGGSVLVTARSTRAAGIEIEISDTGCGMSQEDIRRVLEPFGRASSRLARERHDTGLGLPLSNRFVALLGGRLEIESVVNKGTRITVFLPAAPAASQDSVHHPAVMQPHEVVAQ